jgi:hypothetical protein
LPTRSVHQNPGYSVILSARRVHRVVPPALAEAFAAGSGGQITKIDLWWATLNTATANFFLGLPFVGQVPATVGPVQ